MKTELKNGTAMQEDGIGEAARAASYLGLTGVLVGIGQLLASPEKITWRIAIGRALSSAGLGASSSAVLLWAPDLPMTAQFGLAAMIASLGTSGLERLFQRFIGR